MTWLRSFWRCLLVAVTGWVNRHQLDIVDYLKQENRVLQEHLKGKRVRFTDKQRRRLPAKAKKIGRNVLGELETIVTPDTLLRWHVAVDQSFFRGRPGGRMADANRNRSTVAAIQCSRPKGPARFTQRRRS